MDQSAKRIEVYIETGSKRTFAGAIDWPGWCRSGRDELLSLERLLSYAPRYARALAGKQIAFTQPTDLSTFTVVERIEGNATTDFGAPAIAPSADARPLDEPELHRLEGILTACWGALDAAAKTAEGKELAKGPRGGGRDLHQIVEHAMEAETAYLSRLGWTAAQQPREDSLEPHKSRDLILRALQAAAHGEIPHREPRGAALWTPRYFVRRIAWHALDHAWEIEDRVIASTS